MTSPVKELVKSIATSQGGIWVEKKELRAKEAQIKSSKRFNPKASRTRSF